MYRLTALALKTIGQTWREQTAPRQRRIWKHRLKTWGLTGVIIGMAGYLALLGLASDTLENSGRWLSQKTTDGTVHAGFKVAEIAVTGRRQTPAADILTALGTRVGDPVLSFDPVAAKTALEQLPWVENAAVWRRLPAKILIDITERVPAAIWQNNKKLFLIDREGHVLADAIPKAYERLPLIVGSDAPKAAAEILSLLAAEPLLARRLDAATRIGARRWDLKLSNGINVKLPETNIGLALRRLARDQEKSGLLDRAASVIDLRFDDKIIVRTEKNADGGDKKQKSI